MVSWNVPCWAQFVSVFFLGMLNSLRWWLTHCSVRRIKKRTRTESETFYRSIMTAVDSIKCRCANLGMTGQVQTSPGPSGWFSKSRGLLPWVPEVFLACSGNRARKVCGTQGRGLSASSSFLSSPPPARSFTCAIFRVAWVSGLPKGLRERRS